VDDSISPQKHTDFPESFIILCGSVAEKAPPRLPAGHFAEKGRCFAAGCIVAEIGLIGKPQVEAGAFQLVKYTRGARSRAGFQPACT
jgi:hypothetical protein